MGFPHTCAYILCFEVDVLIMDCVAYDQQQKKQ